MFTIRSGALVLCMAALLTQNVQMQAFSFRRAYNIVKNNPGKTAAAVFSAVILGCVIWKRRDLGLQIIRQSRGHQFQISKNEGDDITFKVTAFTKSKPLFGEEQISIDGYSANHWTYTGLLDHIGKQRYNLKKSELDAMIVQSSLVAN